MAFVLILRGATNVGMTRRTAKLTPSQSKRPYQNGSASKMAMTPTSKWGGIDVIFDHHLQQLCAFYQQ
jgi:hypothetical protein